jgi:Xaa-Pro aminopeptidase
MLTRVRACLVLVTILVPAASWAGPLQEDLEARRGRVMDQLSPATLAIFWSAPVRVYSHDVDYEYRQDSNLFYLTGIDQEDTILVLMPGNVTRREILFIREADPRREHWNGHSLTPAEATSQSGVATVLPLGQFESFITAMFSRRAMGGNEGEYDKFFAALNEDRAKLSVMLEPQRDLSSAPGPNRKFAIDLRERFFGFTLEDATP